MASASIWPPKYRINASRLAYPKTLGNPLDSTTPECALVLLKQRLIAGLGAALVAHHQTERGWSRNLRAAQAKQQNTLYVKPIWLIIMAAIKLLLGGIFKR